MDPLFIVLAIFLFGVLVFFHELGHLIAAVSSGIKVETFSIGLGPKLVGFKAWGVSFQVSWIPFGGYCKVKGEKYLLENSDKEKDGEPVKPEPGSLYAAHPLKRIWFAFAGPLFSFLLGFLAFSFSAMLGAPEASNNINVLSIDDSGREYPAYQAGLLDGDQIISINGKPTDNFDEVVEALDRFEGELNIQYIREERISETTILASSRENFDIIGISPSFRLANPVGFFSAFLLGFQRSIISVGNYAGALIDSLAGGELIGNISGPLRINYELGRYASISFGQDFSLGVYTVLESFGVISLILFFMNLLPLPALDGGQILLFTIQVFKKKPMKPRNIIRYQITGVIIILALIFLALFNDIIFFASGG